LLLRSGSRLGGAAGEEAADSMADGGAYSNTAARELSVQHSGLRIEAKLSFADRQKER
jgi:hypothetical protein